MYHPLTTTVYALYNAQTVSINQGVLTYTNKLLNNWFFVNDCLMVQRWKGEGGMLEKVIRNFLLKAGFSLFASHCNLIINYFQQIISELRSRNRIEDQKELLLTFQWMEEFWNFINKIYYGGKNAIFVFFYFHNPTCFTELSTKWHNQHSVSLFFKHLES